MSNNKPKGKTNAESYTMQRFIMAAISFKKSLIPCKPKMIHHHIVHKEDMSRNIALSFSKKKKKKNLRFGQLYHHHYYKLQHHTRTSCWSQTKLCSHNKQKKKTLIRHINNTFIIKKYTDQGNNRRSSVSNNKLPFVFVIK